MVEITFLILKFFHACEKLSFCKMYRQVSVWTLRTIFGSKVGVFLKFSFQAVCVVKLHIIVQAVDRDSWQILTELF